MNTTYHLTRVSTNGKTGPIPVTTTSNDTCPATCPLRGAGCYADLGPLGLHWARVSDGLRGADLSALTAAIRKFPRGQIWRHNQAGDLPGDGTTIDRDALRALTVANKGRRGFTYTHYPAEDAGNAEAISEANAGGFCVSLSANNLAHADDLVALGLAPVVVVLPADADRKAKQTPAGNTVVPCPAAFCTDKSIQCANCGGAKGPLCARPNRSYIVGFPAHGSRKKAASAIAGGAS
jgi:hypothetical protein